MVWAGDRSADPGDVEILDLARKDGCVLITLDKDFGELAVAFGRDHRGIIRIVDIIPRFHRGCDRPIKEISGNMDFTAPGASIVTMKIATLAFEFHGMLKP